MAKSPKAPLSRAARLIGAVEAARVSGRVIKTAPQSTSSAVKGKTITVSRGSTALRDFVQQAAVPARVRLRHPEEPTRVVSVPQQTLRPSMSEARDLIEATKRSTTGQGGAQAPSAAARQGAREDMAPTLIGAPAVLGRLLSRRRKSLGLSQQALANTAGVGRRFISELEAGKPTSELGKVLEVCLAVGVSLLAVENDQ